jgi:hypothetical protein
MSNTRIIENRGCFFWIPVGLIMTLIGFAPGIIVAAIVDQISPLEFGPLWGTALTTTLVLLIGFYIYDKQKFHLRYLILTVGIFILSFIFTLFNADNFIFRIIGKMYPIVETAKTQYHNIFG